MDNGVIIAIKFSAMETRNQFKIFQGPRQKKLATCHLEYIAHAILSEPDTTTLTQTDQAIYIRIKNNAFNLTNILLAEPDLEHLVFSKEHFNAFNTLLNREQPVYSKRRFSIFAQMHLYHAEKMAIYLWTSHKYKKYNELLRSGRLNTPLLWSDLLAICIASSALSKPLKHPQLAATSARGENSDAELLALRTKASKQKVLVKHLGFTSSSLSMNRFQDKVNIKFLQTTDSYNPLGKHIENIAMVPDEEEITFPPYCEFAYIKVDDRNFKCIPYRSINQEANGETPAYQHTFSEVDLENIAAEAKRLYPKQAPQDLSPKTRVCSFGFFTAAVTTTTLAVAAATLLL